jgi:Flp pilus assembly pilin Flp
MQGIKRFVKEEDRVTAIEYALITAVIMLGFLLSPCRVSVIG